MPDLYLSRLTLPLRNRDTIRLLGDCHAMHRMVMSGFPEVADSQARNALGVLYRVEEDRRRGTIQVLVQSHGAPRWALESRDVRIDEARPMAAFLERVTTGSRHRFRLRANPTRRVHTRATLGPDARERPEAAGKRVAVRDAEARIEWLGRQGKRTGFSLAAAKVAPGMDSGQEAYEGFRAARADPSPRFEGRRQGQQGRLTFETCLFEGVLDVTDAAALQAAVAIGIGPGKAFGCGLLSLAPIATI